MEIDGDMDADGLSDGLTLALGDADADGLPLADGDCDALGLID